VTSIDQALPDSGQEPLRLLEAELAKARRQAQVNRVFAEHVLMATRKLAEQNVDLGMKVEELRVAADRVPALGERVVETRAIMDRLIEERSYLNTALDRAEDELKQLKAELRRQRLDLVQARASLISFLTPANPAGLSAREMTIISLVREMVERVLGDG
jgi:chromosome segregation ATPase